MSIHHLLTRNAVIIPRTQTGTEGKMGEPGWVEGAPVAVKAHVEPRQGLSFDAESVDRPESRASHRAFLPPNTTITTRDRLVLGVESFEVHGAPRHHYNPRTQIESHVEVDLVVHA